MPSKMENRRPNWDLIEDAQFIFDTGGKPREAAMRLGVKLNTILVNYNLAGIEFPFIYDASARDWFPRNYVWTA